MFGRNMDLRARSGFIKRKTTHKKRETMFKTICKTALIVAALTSFAAPLTVQARNSHASHYRSSHGPMLHVYRQGGATRYVSRGRTLGTTRTHGRTSYHYRQGRAVSRTTYHQSGRNVHYSHRRFR